MEWSNAIKVNRDAEPRYGYDQANVNYPTVFPTVTIELLSTDDLIEVCGDEAEFYIGLNGFTKTRVDNCIVVIIGEGQSTIDLGEDEQKEIWDILDKECREAWGKGCEDLLEEAKKLI